MIPFILRGPNFNASKETMASDPQLPASRYLSKKKVPPSGKPSSKYWIIGQNPTEEDEEHLKPFASKGGQRLQHALESNGLVLSDCYAQYLCPYRPADNKFFYAENTAQLEHNLKVIQAELKTHKPAIVLLVGEYALQYIAHLFGIGDWRGSPLIIDGIKFIPTENPGINDPTLLPAIYSDVARFVKYGNEPFPVQNWNFTIDPDGLEAELLIEEILSYPNFSVDIETRKESTHIRCVGFGLSPERAITFPNNQLAGVDPFLRNILTRLLESPNGKILHNSIFDKEVLHLNGIEVNNVVWDTMIAQHVMNLELPRGLDFLVSTYLVTPCYWAGTSRDSEKAWSDNVKPENLYTYNCKDCCVTFAIYEQQKEELRDSDQLRIFEYEMEMLEVSHHISRSGLLLDATRRDVLKEKVTQTLVDNYRILKATVGKDINIASPKQIQKLIFEELALPIQKSKTGALTTDEDALVKLIGICKTELGKLPAGSKNELSWVKKLAVCKIILILRGLYKLLTSYINVTTSADGRVRSTWKIAATETGRLSSALYVDGTGLNSQTFPRDSY